MRRALAGAAAAVLLVPLAACTGDGGLGSVAGGPPVVGASDVDVATPELQRRAREAGLEPCVPGSGDPAAPVEGGLGSVVLPCFGGGEDVDLASLRGPLVINFWASWCGPCRREMPVLQDFHEQHGDRVPVLGVDWSDPQTGAAMDLVLETGVTYPSLADPGEETNGLDGVGVVRGLPLLLFVDEDGRVSGPVYEEVDDVAELVDLVEENLGVAL